MNSHPTRKELIIAARTGSAIPKEHLGSCGWCNEYFELLRLFEFAGELPLVDAPQSWINRAVTVAEKPDKLKTLKSLVASIAFDSWSMPVPQGIRGETLMQERRISFGAANKTLDLRAEHRKNRWDFTARITDQSGHPVDCTLVVGKRELKADDAGFYQWSSVRPPKSFKLLTVEGEIETPELSWKKSQPE